MENNPYNIKDEEQQYNHVISLLKELPKVKSEDNFEYNLKVKIQNKNFNLNYPEKEVFSFWKILVPAGGFVAAIILVLFFFNSPTDNFDNPFQIAPKLRSEALSNFMETRNYADRKINNNDVIIKKEILSKPKLKNSNVIAENNMKLQNSATRTKKAVFPFNDHKSIDLDKTNGISEGLPNMDRRATLTSQMPNFSPFDGFYIREEVDKKYVEALKARLDSLKKEMGSQNQR